MIKGWAYSRTAIVVVALALLAITAYGVFGEPDDSVGELGTIHGQAARAHTRAPDDWAPTSVGETISVGDIVRTIGESTATVRLWSGGMLRVGFDSIVRFLPQGPVETGEVELVTGQAVIEAVGGDLIFGSILVEEGARVRVNISAEVVGLRVLNGRATVRAQRGTRWLSRDEELSVPLRTWEASHRRDAQQRETALTAGRRDRTGRGQEAAEIAADDADSAAAVPAPPSLTYVGPSDLAVRAGGSAVIHERRGRARAKIEFEHLCANGGFVTTGGLEGARFGDPDGHSGTIELRRGRNRYVVYCSRGPTRAPERVAAGTLRLSADSGFSRQPRRAQNNRVNADGRRYNVVYQNLRPALTFRWPSPPVANAYTLHITDLTGRTRRVRRRQPTITLRGAQLRAGMYSWHFEGGGERSPTTWTRLAFEQAPRRFAFTSPGPGRVRPGAVRVAGLAPSGTRVTVAGQEFVSNDSGQFTGTARVASSSGTLAIRVRHPSLGSHIYLRRVRGGS